MQRRLHIYKYAAKNFKNIMYMADIKIFANNEKGTWNHLNHFQNKKIKEWNLEKKMQHAYKKRKEKEKQRNK